VTEHIGPLVKSNLATRYLHAVDALTTKQTIDTPGS
jgi:hypothetical protein